MEKIYEKLKEHDKGSKIRGTLHINVSPDTVLMALQENNLSVKWDTKSGEEEKALPCEIVNPTGCVGIWSASA